LQNNQGRWPSLVAIAMLTNPAGVLGTIAPAIISGLTLEAHLPLLTAGRLMAVEFAAMTAAIMLLPLIMGRISDRTLAGTLIVGAVLGQLSSFSGEVSVIAFGRGILGFAEGGLYGLAIGALARAPRPDRAFAIAVFVNLIVSATLLTLATAAHLAFPAFRTCHADRERESSAPRSHWS
jgi:MFS family permease